MKGKWEREAERSSETSSLFVYPIIPFIDLTVFNKHIRTPSIVASPLFIFVVLLVTYFPFSILLYISSSFPC